MWGRQELILSPERPRAAISEFPYGLADGRIPSFWEHNPNPSPIPSLCRFRPHCQQECPLTKHRAQLGALGRTLQTVESWEVGDIAPVRPWEAQRGRARTHGQSQRVAGLDPDSGLSASREVSAACRMVRPRVTSGTTSGSQGANFQQAPICLLP